MSVLQVIGIVVLAVGLLLLYLEISGRRITESKWLGMTGPIGLALAVVGAVLIVVG